MRIALDATPLIEPTGGVSRYTSQLAVALGSTFPDDEFWLLSDQPFRAPTPAPPNLKTGSEAQSALERRWWLWGLQSEIGRRHIDLFHGTDFAVPYVPVRPSVLTLHDLSPWLDPAWHTEADRVRRRTPVLLRLGLATLVLTPSEAIRREAIARFRLQADRTCVVPHAASPLFRPVPVSPGRPYFLFVGTIEPRKNVGLLVEAWREVRKRRDIDLVLAGRRRDDAPEIASEPGLQILGPVPDERLPELYSGCLACLYPSFYEGFGLPILEAMQCGAAVIASNDPAIMETSGGAAATLDPRDAKPWVDAMLAVCDEPSYRAALKVASSRRAAQFSWERTARLTRDVYREAIGRFRRRGSAKFI